LLSTKTLAGSTVNKSLKTSVFKSSLMAMLLAGAFSAHGAGLGKLSVYSGIGQQLNAEVALSATPAELGAMSARMASPDAFREAGVEYTSVMADVRIALEKNAAGQPVLKLTTVRPVTEPFLHFLVELSWTSGRMVREYTFLLDPPELLQVAKPASVVTPAKPAGKSLPAASQPVAAAKPATPAPKLATAADGEYQVKPGDNLGKIARETKSDSVSLDQMLVALFNSNQDAFSGNNMNRLRAGKILRVPSAEEASQVDPVAARKIVIGQAGEFNAYRNRLAGAVTETPKSENAPRQQVSGAIKPPLEDKAAAATAKDKLEVSRTEPAKAAKPGATTSLEEDLIARDKALREASERIVHLEKNIENLKKLVEVKSQTGVKLQQDSQPTPPAPSAASEKPAEPAKPEAAAPASEAAAKPEETKPAAPAVAAPVAPPTASVAKKPVAPPPPEPSFMDENPEIVYGGGGLVALLLAYLGYSSARRKKEQVQSLDEDKSTAPTFGAAAGAVVDAAADSGEISIQGDFSESGLLTNEEIVDPVAEADVLMAYGRDRQAEEILQEGLNKDPSRPAIHMKLLDLYAKQENIAGYEAVAQKLHALNNGRGADWDKALAVGRTLGLSGGVFTGGEAVAATMKPASDAVEPSVTIEPPAAIDLTATVPQPGETPIVEEVPSLEFDLDLGTTSGAAVAAAEQAIAAPPAEEDLGLDFDFDLGSPEAKEDVEAVVEQAAAADRNALSEVDFDLDLGSPVESDVANLKLADAASAPTATEMPVGGISDLKLDFDLDLDQTPEMSAGQEALAPSTGTLSLQADNPEVATKLELAQAYEEMGDIEGARELLKEVANEGSEAQQAKAREKLDQLSA
jgi:pilus assembly protein FimV